MKVEEFLVFHSSQSRKIYILFCNTYIISVIRVFTLKLY